MHLEVSDVEAPLFVLVEVIGHEGAAVQSERGGVERVLGDRNHDPIVTVANQRFHDVVARDGGAVGEPEVVDVALVPPIPCLDAVSDHLAERGDPLGL